MKSITQIHVDVSTPKKAKKVAAILKSFPTRVNNIVLHRLTEGAVPYTRYALIGCVGRLQIWDFVKPSCTHEVISPKKLKKMLSETYLGTVPAALKHAFDTVRELKEIKKLSSVKPIEPYGTTVRKIDFDEAKGIDFLLAGNSRLGKLASSFKETERCISNFAKKVAQWPVEPIRIDKSELEYLERPNYIPPVLHPFSSFFAQKSPSFPQPFIDHWENTLFNFPLPPFKNVLSEWLKQEEEKATAIKKAKEEESRNQAIGMPKIGDLVVAYDSEAQLPMVGILTRINEMIPMQYQVNGRTYWSNVKKITPEQAKAIYAPTSK